VKMILGLEMLYKCLRVAKRREILYNIYTKTY